MFQRLKDHCAKDEVNLILSDGIFDFVICIDVKRGTYLRKYVKENLPFAPDVKGQYRDFLKELKRCLYGDGKEALEEMKLTGIVGALSVSDIYTVSCKLRTGQSIRYKRMIFCYDRKNCVDKAGGILLLCEDVGDIADLYFDREMSVFSHELRTSLHSLYGSLSIARTEGYQNSRYLESAYLSADYLLRLINGGFPFRETKNDKSVINAEAVTLEELFEYPKVLFEKTAEKKNIQLQILIEKPVCRYIYLNKEIIQQIIINLISNAIKYTNAGGEVLCHVSEEALEGKRVRISLKVKDNGIGMDKDFLRRNFSGTWTDYAREFRMKNVSGRGLGLTLTKEMVDLLQGNIHITAQEGKGTQVVIQFEADGTDVRDTLRYLSDKEEKENHIAVKRVLVAEDEETNMNIVCRYLDELGIEADKAYCGKEVIETFFHSEEEYYDALLLDINLPDINGMKVIRRIRGQNRKDSGLPIIVITADVLEEQEREALSAEISGYITKPYRLEDILSVMTDYREDER